MSVFLAFLFGALAMLALLVLRARTLTFPAQKPGDYAGKGPAFDIRRHLNGPILCEGVIYGPTGRVASRFVADIEARWDGNTGTMAEEFRYDSGATQSRCWNFTLGNDGCIRAEAPDVVGSGEGWQKGSGVHLRYRIRLPEESGGHVLDAIDWMYLLENGTIMNRSQFRKFGIPVAELVATLRPKEAS
ncbi:DUF3833 domain-containing protein [Rhodovulum euryhalinum]|uniref:Uncharacterized protein DUF3833 n=1 Tax=Rhodovulum euryhalinum TaxID=35805 RepID=A0A4R2KGP2_9RHOB|nr:DUF3833 domain-containing protein [Rhodovulum euryhalinum]TCO69609.1 uncharacterized protein DUF3833 [Rhodovulum euryhalinum]